MFFNSTILLNDKNIKFNIFFLKLYNQIYKKAHIILSDIFTNIYDDLEKIELFSWKDDLDLILKEVDYIFFHSTQAFTKKELSHIKQLILNAPKYKVSKIIFFADFSIDKNNLNFIKKQIDSNHSTTKINCILFESIENTNAVLSFIEYINKNIKDNEIIISKINQKNSFKETIHSFKQNNIKKDISNLFKKDNFNKYNIIDFGRYYKVEIEKIKAIA